MLQAQGEPKRQCDLRSVCSTIIHFLTEEAHAWYAVYRGREPGVYATWATCHAQASGFKNCCYKSFPTKEEAIASYMERKGCEDDTMDSRVFEKPPSSGVTKTPCLLVVTLVQCC